jgi:hypothetical protein
MAAAEEGEKLVMKVATAELAQKTSAAAEERGEMEEKEEEKEEEEEEEEDKEQRVYALLPFERYRIRRVEKGRLVEHVIPYLNGALRYV